MGNVVLHCPWYECIYSKEMFRTGSFCTPPWWAVAFAPTQPVPLSQQGFILPHSSVVSTWNKPERRPSPSVSRQKIHKNGDQYEFLVYHWIPYI